jgi:predicted transcriptional regulator
MEDRIALMMPVLNEKQRRLFLASEAKSFGRGGVSEVSRLSGVSRTTIRVGMRELENNDTIDIARVRKVGGGRNYVEDNIPNIQKIGGTEGNKDGRATALTRRIKLSEGTPGQGLP